MVINFNRARSFLRCGVNPPAPASKLAPSLSLVVPILKRPGVMPLPIETAMVSVQIPALPPYSSAPPTQPRENDEVPPLVDEIREEPAPSPFRLRPPPAPAPGPQPDEEGDFNPLRDWGAGGRRAANATGPARGTGASRRAPTIDRQPGRARSMRSALAPEPELEGRRMYYRVYSTKQGATILQAQRPISNADPSLTYLNPVVHLAPPYTVANIKRVICNREGVHPSRATLYLTAPRGTIHPPPPDKRVDIFSETGNCPGERQDDPLMFVVEMTDDPDDDVSQPLSATGSCGKWWRTGCIGRGIVCLFTCPCDACGVWCDICMEDCQRQYARRPEPGPAPSIV